MFNIIYDLASGSRKGSALHPCNHTVPMLTKNARDIKPMISILNNDEVLMTGFLAKFDQSQEAAITAGRLLYLRFGRFCFC